MYKLNLVRHGYFDCSSSELNKNQYVKWVTDGSAAVSVHVDRAIFDIPLNPNKYNVAWLAESSAIISGVINQVKSNVNGVLDKFDMFLTHDLRLLDISEKFVYVQGNSLPWIQNKKIYPKTKNISMISSNKKMCEGHLRRFEIMDRYKDSIDHFGRGFGDRELPWSYYYNNKIESGKLKALKDYRFSIAMENDNYDNAFCEKLTDCFATGTIPIYWGSKNVINTIFNPSGVILLEDFDPSLCTEEYYNSKMEAIQENFEIVSNMLSAEDFFYKNYIN